MFLNFVNFSVVLIVSFTYFNDSFAVCSHCFNVLSFSHDIIPEFCVKGNFNFCVTPPNEERAH